MARKPTVKSKTTGNTTRKTSTVNGRTSNSVSLGKRGGPRQTTTTRKDGSMWYTYSDGQNTYTKKTSGKKPSLGGGLAILAAIAVIVFFLNGLAVIF